MADFDNIEENIADIRRSFGVNREEARVKLKDATMKKDTKHLHVQSDSLNDRDESLLPPSASRLSEEPEGSIELDLGFDAGPAQGMEEINFTSLEPTIGGPVGNLVVP